MSALYKIVDLEQRSKEWKEFRKNKIGASMVGAIMGVDPHRTPLQLWEDIIFDREVQVNAAMQRGIDGEEVALNWLNDNSDIHFHPAVLQSIQYPWMIASLDALRHRVGGEQDLQIVEIKFPNKQVHQMAKEGKVPHRYFPQVQMQMYVAGVHAMKYLSCSVSDYVLLDVYRDRGYIDNQMLPAILAFRKLVVDFVPPEPCDRDQVDLDDPAKSMKAERYIELDRLIWELTQEKEDIRKELIEGTNHPRVNIGGLKMAKIVRMGNIDYKAIPELQNVDLTPYRKKPIESWRLSYD